MKKSGGKGRRDKKASEKMESKMKKQVGSSQDRLQVKMSENLKSSKFRFLNEQLYKNRSGFAAEMFKESPHLFDDVSPNNNISSL
mmetsp:Transcript_32454/g.40207  ORF Transcript_32454/g.40207 Transcript_32454/m.40207 type:complete len:85 (+) Transcript_32454:2-256(+)